MDNNDISKKTATRSIATTAGKTTTSNSSINKKSRNTPTSASGAKAAPPAEEEKKPDPNMVKTLVLIEKKNKSNGAFKSNDHQAIYKNAKCDVTEVKERGDGSFNYQSSVVHGIREAVCDGFNASVLSVEAPNTSSRFESPVWPILNRIVRSLLSTNSNSQGELDPKFSLTCGLGYFNNDRVKDLFNDDDNSPFEPFSVHPSPIYGPCVSQLKYGQITSGNNFEEVLSASLTRALENPVLTSMKEGVAVAFVLIKQARITDGHEDLLLSSLVVASAASDVTPYESALDRVQSETQKYGSIFHLALNGPCCTCFMFNTADDDSIRTFGSQKGESTSTEISRLFNLLQRMSTKENYPLRNGSVLRFIHYMKASVAAQKQKLSTTSSADEKAKLERKIKDQERLLSGAYKTLQDAGIQYDREL
ncbi:hypothetical protein, conserved [Angomonas deanei]|uniref:Uncharacterized protein n=1 Tax=Angomonas deanei TaxID=59799 RepID=A0A7G2CNH0_9TRYP|nr:hypothetical protein, conserved [Angomonas deanei]